MIGVSVGLGNVWRFPYMMGAHGGSSFLLFYLLFTIAFAIPALMAEWAMGRETRKGPLGSFYLVFGNTWGKLVGLLLLVTVVVADSYYLVVIGNVYFSSVFAMGKGFHVDTLPLYQDQLSNGWIQFGYTAALLVLSLWILSQGLNKGIERISQVFVPFFLVVLVYLIYYVANMDGTASLFIDFVTPDLSAINADVLFTAMGQSFFSLGLGGTFMLMYGSYMKADQHIPSSAFLTTAGDLGAAIMASLFIVPAVLFFGLDLAAGPRLLFQVLPELFSVMPGGSTVGSMFLLGLAMVAFLSNLAALEVIAGSIEEFGWPMSRNQLLIALGVVEIILIVPSAFWPGVIEVLDLVFGSAMQTLGSLFTIVGLTWFMKKSQVTQQVFGQQSSLSNSYHFWTKWVVPAVLIVVFLLYITGMML